MEPSTLVNRRVFVFVACVLIAGCASAPPGNLAPDRVEGESIPLDSTNPKYKDYLALVREKIKSNWGYPCVKSPQTTECEYKTTHLDVKFGILKDGQVQFVDVQQSSGLPIYDDYALNAIKRSSPFPEVPFSIISSMKQTSNSIVIVARFNYVLTQESDYATKVELRLPFAGPWFVVWGGRTLAQNVHAAGAPNQRFAYDLSVQRAGRSHAGEGKRNDDYYCFGERILAPAPGAVVSVENGVEDNIPGVRNLKQPVGNDVILAHGNNECSFLCYFRQGTVAVKKGDQVKTGDLLGRCGNSGNSSGPHLHYHLQDSAQPFKGRGLPAPFRGYFVDGVPVERGEPVKGQTIEAR